MIEMFANEGARAKAIEDFKREAELLAGSIIRQHPPSTSIS
jgi:hypothetical protein